MAGFLPQHGVDINADMANIQLDNNDASSSGRSPHTHVLSNVSLPGTEVDSRWDVHLANGLVYDVVVHEDAARGDTTDRGGALLTPSFCHPHIHIDKAYLLSHPKYAQLQVQKGDFTEAMDLTGKAKAQFENEDLVERGQRLIDESVTAGVTHMRAFVEVDAGVQSKCLEAGLQLQRRAAETGVCSVQICSFAQLPLFTASPGDEEGSVIRNLMRAAAATTGVAAIGSTPIEYNLHLDFHLDYNMDDNTEPLVWYVVQTLKDKGWKDHTSNVTIVLGHCSRLTLFSPDEWTKLALEISTTQLPIPFVGLPTSDLFMMRTGQQPELRGTLDAPRLIKDHDLNVCIGVNNIGNAFTPQGSCDPLSLACQGVGIYQAGAKRDADLLYECVSTRARAAIGFAGKDERTLKQAVQPGARADLVLFHAANQSWHTRRSVSEAVYLYDNCQGRTVFVAGEPRRSSHET